MQGVIILFFALLAWGSSLSWGACGSLRNTISWYNSQCAASYQYYESSSTAYSCTNTYDLSYGSCNRTLSYTIYYNKPIVCLGTFNSSWYVYGQYQICDTQCEADSISCGNQGGRWIYTGAATCGGMECKTGCDSTFQCIEYPFNHCEEVPSSGQIYCDANGCTGLPYTKFWSEYRKECTNECGEHDTQSFTADTLISFNTDCSDTMQCSEEYKCVDFPSSQTYLLYSICVVGNSQIGNQIEGRSFASIVGGGNGDCASAGYKSSNFPNSNSGPSFPNSNNNNSVSDKCLIYGIDCPPDFIDSTDFNDNDNRTPEKCYCEPLDGMKNLSSIICPDGSRSTFFGSCDEWNAPRSSSSSNPPESSSSGSENPPTSSGGMSSDSGISGEYPDWNVISRHQKDGNDLLGSIVQTLKSMPSSIVNGVKDYLNGFTYSDSDGDVVINRTDSMLVLDTVLDTAGLLHAIFGRIDSNNTILDTLTRTETTVCPCITFFNGNNNVDLRPGHLSFKQIKIELGDIYGFNLCRIISTVVVALASVVSFFIGFSIFKNISQ